VRRLLDTFALLACSVYGTIPLFWLAVHPFVERWRARGRGAYAFLLPIWGVFIAVAFLLMWPFRVAHLYIAWLAWLPALLFFALGFLLYRSALRNFHHSQISGLDELEPGQHRQQLLTGGIRSRIRHPIYLGHVCEIIGWCIGTGLLPLYAMALFAMATGTVMIRMEDRELEARFGEQFRQYRTSVPAVVPRRWW